MNGFILLDKPIGITSNHFLQKLKKILQPKKIGHTGTLDPLASGMLPIALNSATRFCQYLIDANKVYEVAIKLGQATTTGDVEGEITATKPVPSLDLNFIQQKLPQLIGEIKQIPPMYSAVKYQGKPLYEYARKGIEVPREARTIHVYQLELIDFHKDVLVLRVNVSKGTYIRTLAEMIGEILGTLGYVDFLKRTEVGDFKSSQMVSLETVEQAVKLNQLQTILLPIDTILKELPSITLDEQQKIKIFHGQIIDFKGNLKKAMRIYDNSGHFLGIAEAISDHQIKGKTLIH